MRKAILIFVLLILFIRVSLTLTNFKLIDFYWYTLSHLMDRDGTVYSDKFSELRFYKIHTGESAAEVEKILGQPLRKVIYGCGHHLISDITLNDKFEKPAATLEQCNGTIDEEIWYFTQPKNLSLNYLVRDFVFDKDRQLIKKKSSYWID